jgi:hypothetical protein
MRLTARRALPVALAAAIALAAAAVYAYSRAAQACDSDQALAKVYQTLRDDFHFDSMLVNNVQTVSGNYFSTQRECSAEVTQIRGNVTASDMKWRALRYWIAQKDASAPPTITVKVGDSTPLAEPTLSLWKRLTGQR